MLPMKFHTYIEGYLLAHHPYYNPLEFETDSDCSSILEHTKIYKNPIDLHIFAGKFVGTLKGVSEIQLHWDSDTPDIQLVTLYNENDEVLQEIDISRTINIFHHDRATDREVLWMFPLFEDFESNKSFPKLQLEYEGTGKHVDGGMECVDASTIVYYPSEKTMPIPLVTMQADNTDAINNASLMCSRFVNSTKLAKYGIEKGVIVILNHGFSAFRPMSAPYLVLDAGDIDNKNIKLAALWKDKDTFEGSLPLEIFAEKFIGVLPGDTLFIGSEDVSYMLGDSRVYTKQLDPELSKAIWISSQIMENFNLQTYDGLSTVAATVEKIISVFNANSTGYLALMSKHTIVIDIDFYISGEWRELFATCDECSREENE